MVNQQLVNYFKEGEARGHTQQQLRDTLIQQGHDQNEVDEAIHYTGAGNIHPPQQTPTTQETSGPARVKRRNPFLILVFTLITFGIYGIYWVVSTTNELRKNTKSAPNPWLLLLMIIPFVNFIVMIFYFWKYSKAINELTGFNTLVLLILWIFIGPVAMILSQMELNKKAG